jgi:hypothetical protein
VNARFGLPLSREFGSERGEPYARLLLVGFEAGKESLGLGDLPDQLVLRNHSSSSAGSRADFPGKLVTEDLAKAF